MRVAKGLLASVAYAVVGSFLAFGCSLFFLFVNSVTLGTEGQVGGFWTLIASFFGATEIQAVAGAANLAYFGLAGCAAGLGAYIFWPYPDPERRQVVAIGIPAVGGIIGVVVGAFAFPLALIAIAPDVVRWMTSQSLGDWLLLAAILVGAGMIGGVGGLFGRAIGGMVVRTAGAPRPSRT